jgi:surface protein
MPKSSKEKGGAKKEYIGTYRHFTLHEVNGKKVEIGTADIKDHQTPLSAAKKLLSSWCRNEGIKSNERNKVNIIFTIRETTRGHSKVYGPYKGKFIKYDKPVMIKLKSGKSIKIVGKPMVKLAKGNNNKKMIQKGGDKIVVTDKDHLLELIIKGEDLSNLDVSNVTDMSKIFENFNFLERSNSYISGWDVSNVNNMKEMFKNSKGFNQNLNNWDVSNVKNMSEMFYNCKDLNQSFNKWEIEVDTQFDKMFYGCDKYIRSSLSNRFGYQLSGKEQKIGIKKRVIPGTSSQAYTLKNSLLTTNISNKYEYM